MSWFGWLTKGNCEVSALDGFTFVAELVSLFALVLVLCAIHQRFKK